MSDNKSLNCSLNIIDAFEQMTRLGHNHNKGWKLPGGGKLCQEHIGKGEAEGVLVGETRFPGSFHRSFYFCYFFQYFNNPPSLNTVDCFDMLMC